LLPRALIARGSVVRLVAFTAVLGLLGIGSPVGVAAQRAPAAPGGARPDKVDKVEPKLRADLAKGGQTTFWVVLREKANLRAAPTIQNRSARGQFVGNELQQTANRSQAALRGLLQKRGVTHQPYWVANTIRVTGDKALLDDLAASTR